MLSRSPFVSIASESLSRATNTNRERDKRAPIKQCFVQFEIAIHPFLKCMNMVSIVYIPIQNLTPGACLSYPLPFFFLYVKLLRSGYISGMCLIISTHRGLISYFVEGNMTVSWLRKFTFTKGGRTKVLSSMLNALIIFVRKTTLAEPTQYRMAVKDT